MTTREEIVAQIVHSSDNFKAAFDIASSFNDAKQWLLFARLGSQIPRILRRSHPNAEVKADANNFRQFAGVDVIFSDDSIYQFGIEAQAGNLCGIVWGFYPREKAYDLSKDIITFKERLGDALNNKSWVWYKKGSDQNNYLMMSENWLNDPIPWIKIAEGKLAVEIAEAVEKLKSEIGDDTLF